MFLSADKRVCSSIYLGVNKRCFAQIFSIKKNMHLFRATVHIEQARQLL